MPDNGKRVYNPFGGGVQMGFVVADYGHDYIASEIRQNQCDANNALCSKLKGSAKWIKSDSSSYQPEGKFDLVFTCPPYYKVEEYLDYDGNPPEGELNSLPTYEQFRDMLFEGYKKAIQALNDNCFLVVMTGDSRDSKGAYYGCEAEHEIFFKNQGLHIYNKIVYLECEFTRLAHAKTTIGASRKFPKREQKILVFYKGDISKIGDRFGKIGRL
jgi:DNA modification methylase